MAIKEDEDEGKGKGEDEKDEEHKDEDEPVCLFRLLAKMKGKHPMKYASLIVFSLSHKI